MDRKSQARRRYLGAGAAGLALLATGSRAQAPGRHFRIGVLANHVPRAHLELGIASPFEGSAAFVAALAKAGWELGRKVQLSWRSAEGRMDHHPRLVAELIRMRVEMIVGGDDAVHAAARATQAIPIVAYAMWDPIANGYAETLARPRRNVTGIANSAGAEIQKSLSLLKEASPGIRRVALIAQSRERADDYPVLRPGSALEKAGIALGLELFFMTFGEPDTLPEVVASAARRGADALMMDSNYAIHYYRERRERLARDAARYRLPLLQLNLAGIADGALMGHGTDLTERWRRAAYFADRILRGEKPGDIPIEHPPPIQLHINLKAARAIGLQLPATLLLQADRVFE